RSLLVDDGEIVIMYPFGLPNVSTAPYDLVRELLETGAHRRSPATNRLLSSGLLGMPIEARFHATSNTFAVFGADDDAESAFGVRLAFTEHRLMVETTAETRLHDVDLEIRLGSYGNHYVRIAFTTDHRTAWTDRESPWCHAAPACPETAACLNGPWAAHDIDQWVRRAGLDVGDETVWLEAPGSDPESRTEQQHLVDLAATIVDALQQVLDDRDNQTDARIGNRDPSRGGRRRGPIRPLHEDA